jgi:hypothetical protein
LLLPSCNSETKHCNWTWLSLYRQATSLACTKDTTPLILVIWGKFFW